MKRYIWSLLMGLLVCLTASQLWAQSGQATFEKLKSLQGDWQGEKDGQLIEVNYKLMSNGSALVETINPASESSMVTVYHLNGDKLMMTHYCSAGNQPRMAATPMGDDNEISFEFMDATNLKNKNDGHMQALQIIFDDPNNIREIWTWREGDKQMPGTFKLTRKA